MIEQIFYWTGVATWLLIGGFAITSTAVSIALKCCTDMEILITMSRLTEKKIRRRPRRRRKGRYG